MTSAASPSSAHFVVHEPEVRREAGGTRVHFRHSGAPCEGGFDVFLAGDWAPAPESLGAAAACFHLWPAMRLGCRLSIEAEVPADMRARLETLQTIQSKWFPHEFSRVPVEANWSEAKSARSSAEAVFFSGGADSSFSLLRRKEDFAAGIFVTGFDIGIENRALAENIAGHLRSAAARFGIPLVEATTNVRTFSDTHCHWGSHYCGAAMAGVAHLMAERFGIVSIPASVTWEHLSPFGTHPFTDEQWTAGPLEVRHDGMETPRIEKFRLLATIDGTLDHLRVCWRNPDNTYNCGHCEKCLRAMANLRALGALERAATFPSTLDASRLESLEIEHVLILPFLEETITEAERVGDTELAQALQSAIHRFELDRLRKVPLDLLEHLPESSVWRGKTAPRFRNAIAAACLGDDPLWTANKLLHALPGDERAAMRRQIRRRWWRRLADHLRGRRANAPNRDGDAL